MLLRALSGRMGTLPIHIYGDKYEHDVIVYTVVKDTQSQAIVFKSLSFGPFTLNFHWTKTGSTAFSKVSIFEGRKRQSSVNDRRNRSKSYAF